MNCIIIDDEPMAIEILKRYVEDVSFLKLLNTFRDPIQALTFIHQKTVDLIFLDINMPGLSGIQLAQILSKEVLFIFTTAYSEHAIKGYELNTVDYLLKPIEFDRFLKAVAKADELKALRDNNKGVLASGENRERIVFFKSGTTIYKIDVDDILYLEKEGNYFYVYTSNGKKLLVRMNFQDIFNLLPAGSFTRVHKSYIINIKHIDQIESQQIIINKAVIPIGITYREELMNLVKPK
jgi:two-component system, LytTR family, response regulator